MPRISRSTFIAAVIAALLAGLGLAIFARRGSTRRDREDSETVETPRGTVEYATMGKGAPLLVLHGAGGGFDQGLHLTSALAEHGYRLIAPSRFGYLRSRAAKEATPASQAEAYAALLDRLGIKQTFVLAISAGTWSALHFALRYPQRCRALVLLVPATQLPTGTKFYGWLIANTLFRSNLLGGLVLRLAALCPRLGAALMGTPVAPRSADEKKRVRQVLLDGLPVRTHAEGMKLDIAAAHARAGFPMRGIIAPVLAISAADDGFRTAPRAKEIAGAVRDGRVIIFPTGGHLLVERQADVVREVVAFLEK